MAYTSEDTEAGGRTPLQRAIDAADLAGANEANNHQQGGNKRPGVSHIEKVLEERKKSHGVFVEMAQITQDLKNTMRAAPGWNKLTPSMQEAMDMTAHKQARILSGDASFLDHWIDILGYNKLVVNELEAQK